MIDAHAHLSDPRLEKDIGRLVGGLQSAGLKRVVLGGVDASDWETQAKLQSSLLSFVTPVLGIHPWTVRVREEAELESMFAILESAIPHVKALGEVGVDFHPKRMPDQLEKQVRWCRRQLQLAQKHQKPVVLHVVHGHDVMQNILRAIEIKSALVHGFRGKHETAKFYLDRGYVLSLGARSFRGLTLADYMWLSRDNFTLESDAPPSQRDVSDVDTVCREWIESLAQSAKFLAELWSISSEEVWSLAEINLARFLG